LGSYGLKSRLGPVKTLTFAGLNVGRAGIGRGGNGRVLICVYVRLAAGMALFALTAFLGELLLDTALLCDPFLLGVRLAEIALEAPVFETRFVVLAAAALRGALILLGRRFFCEVFAIRRRRLYIRRS
jgi:hypothetical protein